MNDQERAQKKKAALAVAVQDFLTGHYQLQKEVVLAYGGIFSQPEFSVALKKAREKKKVALKPLATDADPELSFHNDSDQFTSNANVISNANGISNDEKKTLLMQAAQAFLDGEYETQKETIEAYDHKFSAPEISIAVRKLRAELEDDTLSETPKQYASQRKRKKTFKALEAESLYSSGDKGEVKISPDYCARCLRLKVLCTRELSGCSKCSKDGKRCVYSKSANAITKAGWAARGKPGPKRGANKRMLTPTRSSTPLAFVPNPVLKTSPQKGEDSSLPPAAATWAPYPSPNRVDGSPLVTKTSPVKPNAVLPASSPAPLSPVPLQSHRFACGTAVKVYWAKTLQYYDATIEGINEFEGGSYSYDVFYRNYHRLECNVTPDRVFSADEKIYVQAKPKANLASCQYCGQKMGGRGIHKHELSCSMNPNSMSAEVVAVPKQKANLASCKFCGQKMGGRGIFKHELGCSLNPANSSPASASMSESGFGESGQDTACEYCGGWFNEKGLKRHQASCDMNPNKYWPKDKEEPQHTCRHCGKKFHSKGISRHELSCDLNPQRRTLAWGVGKNGNMIPCQYCGVPLKKRGLLNHESFCTSNPNRSTAKPKAKAYLATCQHCGQKMGGRAIKNHEMSCTKNPSSSYQELTPSANGTPQSSIKMGDFQTDSLSVDKEIKLEKDLSKELEEWRCEARNALILLLNEDIVNALQSVSIEKVESQSDEDDGNGMVLEWDEPYKTAQTKLHQHGMGNRCHRFNNVVRKVAEEAIGHSEFKEALLKSTKALEGVKDPIQTICQFGGSTSLFLRKLPLLPKTTQPIVVNLLRSSGAFKVWEVVRKACAELMDDAFEFDLADAITKRCFLRAIALVEAKERQMNDTGQSVVEFFCKRIMTKIKKNRDATADNSCCFCWKSNSGLDEVHEIYCSQNPDNVLSKKDAENKQQSPQSPEKDIQKNELQRFSRPKRPKSAFLYFLKAQNRQETRKEVVRAWQNLPADEKEKWQNMFKADQHRYESQMQLFRNRFSSGTNMNAKKRGLLLLQDKKLKSFTSMSGKEKASILWNKVFFGMVIYKEELKKDLNQLQQDFIIPKDDKWPTYLWELALGQHVHEIKQNGTFVQGNYERRLILKWLDLGCEPSFGKESEDLKNLITNYPVNHKDPLLLKIETWVSVYFGLLTFRSIHGHVKVHPSFRVPSESPWKKDCWGLKLGSKVLTIRYAGAFVKKHLERAQAIALIGFDFSPKTIWGRVAKRFLNELEGKGKSNGNEEEDFSDTATKQGRPRRTVALDLNTDLLPLKRNTPSRKKASPKLKRKRPRLDLQSFPLIPPAKDGNRKTGFLLFLQSEKKAIMEAGFFHKSTLYNEAKKRWAVLSYDEQEMWGDAAEKYNARLQEQQEEDESNEELDGSGKGKGSSFKLVKQKSSRKKKNRAASSISPFAFRSSSSTESQEQDESGSALFSVGRKSLKPKTAYHCFRRHLVDTNQIVGKERSHFAKACSQRWHSLSPREKHEWKVKADKKNSKNPQKEFAPFSTIKESPDLGKVEKEEQDEDHQEKHEIGALGALVGQQLADQLKVLYNVNESVRALIKKSLELYQNNKRAKEELATLEMQLVSLTIESNQRKKQKMSSHSNEDQVIV